MAMEIYSRNQSLWKGIILHKYGPKGQWCTNKVTNTYGVDVWKSIRHLWMTLKLNTKVRFGRGGKVLFWEEDWSGHGTLQSLFPKLFSISLNTGCRIQEMWFPQGWNLTFRRLLNDWEIHG